ncbi:MAG TPA: propanediol/glycerol family dehydratase large subunit [Solirubrobacteraceae bacterium]|nr:propanediol/glycerol family dehydratase large subunit [Solirubrobacteraceae bacterium]
MYVEDRASARSEFLAKRPISQDNLVAEDPALGLVAFSSPFDPEPSLRIAEGRVVELDGKAEADFDMVDEFIARHGIDARVAEEAMATPTPQFARMIVDPGVPRGEVARLAAGMTPAKIAAALTLLTSVEILQAIQKMRVRRTPSIQAHVTNRIDHPLLMAADAASAVALGFRELETTVPVLRHAPSNALALLIGSQVGHAGALTQCSVEERTELELGMRGLTTYAETVSVYGTEQVFIDGDDTPWSKAFLASCYASRGLKMRFTSGSGAEVLMGESEGKSMLYLEARCVALARAAGAQGVQNGGIDGVNVTASVPDGMREVIAENLCVMLHDLESCTGNDTLMSASDIRRTAHTLPLLLAGTDFLFSGFGSIPAYDNAFGPSNMNAEDLDDYLVVQRDWGFEGGLRWRDDAELLEVRRRAAEACRAVFEELGLARFADGDVDGCVRAHGSLDVPPLAPALPELASERIMDGGTTALDVVGALSARGFEVEAERVLEMIRQRLLGDLLQTSAILDEELHVLSALSDPNDYSGPGTGYRISPKRRSEIAQVRQVRSRVDLMAEQEQGAGSIQLHDKGPAVAGTRPDEVVVAVSPAFGRELWVALNGMTVAEVLREVVAGIEDEGLRWRIVRVHRSIDLGSIGWAAARLSGSGVSVALQAKGTALIHRADLPPLANLELFSIAPHITPELYRDLGRNAARYAQGLAPEPLLLPESSEPLGSRYHAQVVQLVAAERRLAEDADPVELVAEWPS